MMIWGDAARESSVEFEAVPHEALYQPLLFLDDGGEGVGHFLGRFRGLVLGRPLLDVDVEAPNLLIFGCQLLPLFMSVVTLRGQ